MARRSKETKQKLDPFERVRLKKLRSQQRRDERKKRRQEGGDDATPNKKTPRTPKLHDPNDLGWLKSNGIRMAANKIMNDSYRSPAPFWLSVPSDPRPEPADFYPCRSFQRGNRTWFGFIFREHRDQQILLWGGNARKELTEDAQGR